MRKIYPLLLLFSIVCVPVCAADESSGGITTSAISDSSITEPKLKIVNPAVDEYCLTYEATIGDFEWQICSPVNYAASSSPAGPATSALSVTGLTANKCLRTNGSGLLVVASGDCSAGDTTIVNYAASASPAGPATSALSVTGFTATKCARFNGSGVLVAATADCPDGDTGGGGGGGGIGGNLGSVDGVIPVSDGTGGVTLKTSGGGGSNGNGIKFINGVLDIPSGFIVRANSDNVSTPIFQLSYSQGMVIADDFGYCYSNVTDDASGSAVLCIINNHGYGGVGRFIFTNDGYNGAVPTGSADFLDTTALYTGLRPVASSPFTCNSGNEGKEYVDTSHAKCYCDGVSFQVMNPLTSGVGSCS